MDAQNGRIPDIYGEIDYLWAAMKTAQEESARLSGERAAGEKDAAALKGRITRLENALREGGGREQALRSRLAALQTDRERADEALREAVTAAGETRLLRSELNDLRRRLAEAFRSRELQDARMEALREELKGAGDRLAEKEYLIAGLSSKIDQLKALPEISEALSRAGAAAGREPALVEDLLARIGGETARNAALSEELARLKAEAGRAAEAARGLDRRREELEAGLEAQKSKAQTLSAALTESSGRLELAAGEKARLEREIADILAAREALRQELSAMSSERERARKELEDKDARIAELGLSLQDAALKTAEQKHNFTDAVRKIFELQSAAAALRTELAESRRGAGELAAALEAKKAEAERLNAMLREAGADVRQERGINKRSFSRIKALESEAEAYKARIVRAEEYAGTVLKKLEEREKHIDALKKELANIPALEHEIGTLKMHNRTLAGFIRTEQAEFTAKITKHFTKIAADLKLFNMRLPAEQAKRLSPSLKNLYAAVNLLKAWQTYMDEGEFEKETCDLKQLLSEAAAPWEKTFAARKFGFSAYPGAARAAAGINRQKIKMALYQLIKNAYENLAPGSSLKITLELSADRRYAAIKLDDTGPGLPRDVIERLFAPFNTSKKDHVGLGLALVSRIAALHGGGLTVANKKERGLLAVLKLPLSDEHGEPPLA